jgi:deoxyribodipyrimidine photo-lyase
MYRRSLFIFRRDYRIADNTGLRAAFERSEEVLAAFIFDPRQANPEKNRFFSSPAFHFLLVSLRELADDIQRRGGKLYVFKGGVDDVVSALLQQDGVDAVFANEDYTPFARQRDEALRERCASHNVPLHLTPDALLTQPDDVTPPGGVYTVFSRFRRAAQKRAVPRPQELPSTASFRRHALVTPTSSLDGFDARRAPQQAVTGGRQEGLALLDAIPQRTSYRNDRHAPAKKAMTLLSAHHKFGTVSIRETYWKIKDSFEGYHKLLSQIYWRDFYTHLLYHRPALLRRPLKAYTEHISWNRDRAVFDRWCAGETGVPFVDAGMRELNQTGYMHNRARMVVASFLTKDLLMPWRWGAQYFARSLTDYDPAVNNGNWQWAASVGTDYRLRIYNPYAQAKKHDPAGTYIQHWVPELRPVDTKVLTNGDAVDFSEMAAYPPPVVERNAAYHRAKEAFASARTRHKETMP